ncbi:SHUGOSHIN 2-like [Iris pallida]|uniref:SHUGOSHIN 2-like n=1 Tax=Iris pallida TaxID=29817 RepID=A0AAX6E7T3_IRIPA|nr:SHUGOSHIN 2-like [Iris pallida]
MIGSVARRKKLSDITNTVGIGSSRLGGSSSQFQENHKVSCGVTKDCISQLIEENSALLKAIGERNKIIELSSMELQKFRVALEKGNQQNRQLALVNSQMLAELNLSKERAKALQHELGCTLAVLRLKNSELDEKEKLNKELHEKITRKEVDKCVEVTNDASEVPSVSNKMTHELDKDLDLDEKLNGQLYEDIIVEENLPKCSETATDASIPHATSTCNPNMRRTLRTRNRSSTSLVHEVQEEEKNELHEKIRDEGKETLNRDLCDASEVQPKSMEVATAASEAHSVDTINTASKQNRKRSLRNQASCFTNATHQAEGEDVATAASEAHLVDTTNMPSKPNRKRSLRNEASCSTNSTLQAEGKDKDARIRRSSRRRYTVLEQEPCESKDYLFEIVDADIPGCSSQSLNEENPIQLEPSARSSLNAPSKHEADEKKDQTASSPCQTQEPRRTSVGRPTRRAAEKVGSYKEIPLNVKMRR